MDEENDVILSPENTRQKRSATIGPTCPDANWYKNLLGDCIKFMLGTQTQQDARADCTGQNANLLDLSGGRAPVMYMDMYNNKFSTHFNWKTAKIWLDATKDNQGKFRYTRTNKEVYDNEYFSDPLTNQHYNPSDLCIVYISSQGFSQNFD